VLKPQVEPSIADAHDNVIVWARASPDQLGLVVSVVSTATPRVVTSGCLARTQEARCSSAA
jgi:hypothetical protein